MESLGLASDLLLAPKKVAMVSLFRVDTTNCIGVLFGMERSEPWIVAMDSVAAGFALTLHAESSSSCSIALVFGIFWRLKIECGTTACNGCRLMWF